MSFINEDDRGEELSSLMGDAEIEVIPHRRINWRNEAKKYARSFIPPIFYWIREYDRMKLRGDLIAGITVCVLLIPQGMAYASLAGLPPIYGLYAGLIPPLVYAIFGTSMQMTIGPVAVIALLTASAVTDMGFEQDTDEYISATSSLAFAQGFILLGMGFLNIGFIVDYFSHTVLSAFISATSVIISASQIKSILGISIANTESFPLIVWRTASQIGNTSWVTLVGSIICLGALYAGKKIKQIPKWVPLELLAMLIGIIIGWTTSLDIQKVGHVPSGLPFPAFPPLTKAPLATLFTQGAIIAVVSFITSIALAKTFALRHNYEINATQELVAQGASSIVTSFFLGHPVTASISRTSINDEMGAKTPLAGLATGTLVAICLLFLTPVFQHLPVFILACVVLLSVRSLFDYKEAIYLWKTDKSELVIYGITFFSTLFLGVSDGIFLSILISLLVVIHRASRPTIATLGLTKQGVYRNIRRFPNAITHSGIVVLRVDANLFFGNTRQFKDKIYDVMRTTPDLRCIIIDGGSFTHIDTSSLHVLESIYSDLASKKIMFEIINVRGPARDILRKSGATTKQTLDLKVQISDAIHQIEERA